MDNLSHALLGVAVGALRRPEGGRGSGLPASATDRAAGWAAVLAASVPDLDMILGWGDVLGSFKYHRGYSHSFLLAPVLAAAVTLAVRLRFRQARTGPVYAVSLLALLLAHLAADIWTGWGTMAFLPFSDQRIGLDWVAIVDPLLTGVLLIGALVGRYRPHWRRRALLLALTAVFLYVGGRGAIHTSLTRQVAAQYPSARVQVWADFLPIAWGYAAHLGDTYAIGAVGLGRGVREQQRVPAPASDPAVAAVQSHPELAPLLRFTRFPVIDAVPRPDGGARVSITDLRYTYALFQVDLDRELRLESIRQAPSFGR